MITEDSIREALRRVVDPDVGINIVDLGLVESIRLAPEGLYIDLIMTTPACPQSSYLADQSEREAKTVAGEDVGVSVAVLPAPLWEPSRLSAAAKAALGWPR